jgi:hypothetical protein
VKGACWVCVVRCFVVSPAQGGRNSEECSWVTWLTWPAPRLGRAAQGLHRLAAQRGTRRRPGRHLPRPSAQAPLPRRDQEPRLAQAAHRTRDLRHYLAPRLGKAPGDTTGGRISYNLRRLCAHQIIERILHGGSYQVTADGLTIALFFTRLTQRVLNPRPRRAHCHRPVLGTGRARPSAPARPRSQNLPSGHPSLPEQSRWSSDHPRPVPAVTHDPT